MFFILSAAEMKHCVESWPTESKDSKMVFLKEPATEEDGTQKIGYKTIFQNKVRGLRNGRGKESFRNEGLRCFTKHFTLRHTCTRCHTGFRFNAKREMCKAECDVKWTLEETNCICFGEEELMDPDTLEFDGVEVVDMHAGNETFLTPTSSAQAAVVKNLLTANHPSTPSTSKTAAITPRQLFTPSSLLKTPKHPQSPRWPKALTALNECPGPFTPTGNSRVQKEVDGLMECIQNTGAGVTQIVQGIQLAKSYILNVESFTKLNPAVSPTTALDANKALLARAIATKVYRNVTLEHKDSKAILSEIAGMDKSESIAEKRNTVKRKLDEELDGSLESEKGHKQRKQKKQKKQKKHKHKSDRKKSRDVSHNSFGSSSDDQENIDVLTI